MDSFHYSIPVKEEKTEEEKEEERYNENNGLLKTYYRELEKSTTEKDRAHNIAEMSLIINEILMYLLKYNGLEYVLELLYEFIFEKDFILTKELLKTELPNIEIKTEDNEKMFIRKILKLRIITINSELDGLGLTDENKTSLIILTLFNRLNEISGGSGSGYYTRKFVTGLAALSSLAPSGKW